MLLDTYALMNTHPIVYTVGRVIIATSYALMNNHQHTVAIQLGGSINKYPPVRGSSVVTVQLGRS